MGWTTKYTSEEGTITNFLYFASTTTWTRQNFLGPSPSQKRTAFCSLQSGENVITGGSLGIFWGCKPCSLPLECLGAKDCQLLDTPFLAQSRYKLLEFRQAMPVATNYHYCSEFSYSSLHLINSVWLTGYLSACSDLTTQGILIICCLATLQFQTPRIVSVGV